MYLHISIHPTSYFLIVCKYKCIFVLSLLTKSSRCNSVRRWLIWGHWNISFQFLKGSKAVFSQISCPHQSSVSPPPPFRNARNSFSNKTQQEPQHLKTIWNNFQREIILLLVFVPLYFFLNWNFFSPTSFVLPT